jgi:membrane associated rhomboid family serine protease
VKTILFIVLGVIPAVALRYAILRKPISLVAAAGACFGILIYVAILVSTNVQNQFQKPADDPVLGPLPILTDLVSQMAKVSVPVVLASFFILRAKSAGDDDGEPL